MWVQSQIHAQIQRVRYFSCYKELWFSHYNKEIPIFYRSQKSFKGQTKSEWFFQSDDSSKKWMNEFDFTAMIPQVNLCSFVFWKKSKTPKNHFEINWPLEGTSSMRQIISFPTTDEVDISSFQLRKLTYCLIYVPQLNW